MSADCALPQPARLAYAVCPVLTVLEQQPRNSKTRLESRACHIRRHKGETSPRSRYCANPRLPCVAEFRKPLSGRAGIVRPEAAFSRVAAGPRNAWADATRRA